MMTIGFGTRPVQFGMPAVRKPKGTNVDPDNQLATYSGQGPLGRFFYGDDRQVELTGDELTLLQLAFRSRDLHKKALNNPRNSYADTRNAWSGLSRANSELGAAVRSVRTLAEKTAEEEKQKNKKKT